MTTETIEWYSPNEKSPECPPGSPLLVITQDDRCVTDQIWTPQGFAYPDQEYDAMEDGRQNDHQTLGLSAKGQ